MTKQFVADESVRVGLLDKTWELVRRVKDGTLDGEKVLHRLQWLIENNNIIRTWRDESELDFLDLSIEYQIEENIRIGCHKVLKMSEGEYRSSLLRLDKFGSLERCSYPTIIDPRIQIWELLKLHKVFYPGLYEGKSIFPESRKDPYLLFVLPGWGEWIGSTKAKDILEDAQKKKMFLLSPRELSEYIFHYSYQAPDPRATSVRKIERLIAGSTIELVESRYPTDFSAFFLMTYATPKGDMIKMIHNTTTAGNSQIPWWKGGL